MLDWLSFSAKGADGIDPVVYKPISIAIKTNWNVVI